MRLKDFDLEIDFNEIHSISLFFKDPSSNEMTPLTYIDLDRDYRIYYEGGSNLEEINYTIYIENAEGTDYFDSSFELKSLTIIGLNISKTRDIPAGTIDFRDFNQLVDYFDLDD
ncbi:hypothetical protein Q2T41_07620 [Maribacter confluentis]|uniref:Uncharacterized protein n=2 Tax=Maribacter confluentis TaxID=1656093 RepID=A0ABT8RQ92_9FLAO|nr:hypothetical protein [Maribacter confluentis]MDO1512519.1 hypothetical protein [Maribacter confluentis]